MQKAMLDKNSDQPLYQQLAKFLKTQIKGVEKYNDKRRLPTEREIAEQFDVSRITVRQALKLLEEQNLIVREQGKGTFLKENKIQQPIRGSRSFSQVVKESGNVPGAKLISSSIQLADEAERAELNLPKDAYIVAIERVRFINEVPAAYEISHFTRDYSFLLAQDFNNSSLYDYISQEKGITFTDAKRTIEIAFPTKEIAAHLEIKETDPLLLITGKVYDKEGKVAMLSYEYLVADKFKFEI